MTETTDPIRPLQVAVVEADLLWQVDHANAMRPLYADGFDSLVAALSHLAPAVRAVVVIGPTALSEVMGSLAAVRDERPELSIIVVTADNDLAAAARAAAVASVVSADATPQEVAAEAAALLASDDGRPGGHGDDASGGQGRVVLCTGAKAGEGTTTVAVNLALTMARSDAGPVALIDADPNFGDVAFLLRLPGPEPVDRRDQQVLSPARAAALALRHDDSGLTVFIPPRVAGQFAMPPTESYVNLIHAAQQAATTVIIDAPFWAVIEHGLHAYADLVVLNTLDDLASLKNAAIATTALGRDEHVRVVVNRVDPEGRGIFRRQDGPGEQDIERALRCDVIERIPELREVDRQGATGAPAVLASPSSPFANTMRDLAARVARLLEPA